MFVTYKRRGERVRAEKGKYTKKQTQGHYLSSQKIFPLLPDKPP
tara:strand:- start:779 stop:910 length:132 start_codon:yes stop_codon:yes gene_type:complete